MLPPVESCVEQVPEIQSGNKLSRDGCGLRNCGKEDGFIVEFCHSPPRCIETL